MKLRKLLRNLFQLTVNLFKEEMLRNLRIVDLKLIFLDKWDTPSIKRKGKVKNLGLGGIDPPHPQ